MSVKLVTFAYISLNEALHYFASERNYQTYLESRGYRAEYSESSEKSRQDRYRGTATTNTSMISSFKRSRDSRDDIRKPIRPERYEDR
jgi:hypothetical protein